MAGVERKQSRGSGGFGSPEVWRLGKRLRAARRQATVPGD
jgi:hypothetical protein